MSRNTSTSQPAKTTGKRRASSPAGSDASARQVAQEYAKRCKRVKVEPRATPAPSTRAKTPAGRRAEDENDGAAGLQELETPEVIRVRREFEESWKKVKRERARASRSEVADGQAAQTAAIVEYTRPASRDNGLVTRPSPEAILDETQNQLIQVLKKSGTRTTAAFHALIKQVLDQAFKVVSTDGVFAPGLGAIEHIVDKLTQQDDVPRKHVEAFAVQLREGWRHRMATYLGQNVGDAEELRDVMNVLVQAVSFRGGGQGFGGAVLGLTYSGPEDGGQAVALTPVRSAVQTAMAATASLGRGHGDRIAPGQVAATPSAASSPVAASTVRSQPGTSQVINHANLERSEERLVKKQDPPSPPGTKPTLATPPPSSSPAQPHPTNPTTTPNPSSLAPNTASPILPLHHKFKHTIDTFLYHVQQYQLHHLPQPRRVDSEALRQKAEEAWDALSSSQKSEWRVLHRLLRRDDARGLDEEGTRMLLRGQGVVGRVFGEEREGQEGSSSESESSSDADVDFTASHGRRSVPAPQPIPIPTPRTPKTTTSSETRIRYTRPRLFDSIQKPTTNLNTTPLSPQPIKIPFPCHSHGYSDRHVAFTFNHTECPLSTMNADELRKACSRRFGVDCVDVKRANEHIWIVDLIDPGVASRAKGQSVMLHNNFSFTAEHLYPAGPKIFIADFSSIPAGEKAVAVAISAAFPDHLQTGLALRVQEAPKLYAGRQFTLTFSRNPWLMRFYIALPQASEKRKNEAKAKAEVMDKVRKKKRKGLGKGEEWIWACFKPLNIAAPCVLCRDAWHGREACAHAKVVGLPAA